MKKFNFKLVTISILVFGMILMLLGVFLNSYALMEPIRTVSFNSQELNYNSKEPGSIHVDKSAEWIAKNKARITFDIDTIRQTNNLYRDVILVLDTSSSMRSNSFDQVKQDAIRLLDDLLLEQNDQVALITFASTSQIVSEFTNNKEELADKINALTISNGTSYYQALVNVDNLLNDYQKDEEKDCIVLFLTDGYPSSDVPNEVTEYSYLKEKYPYLTVHAIQYEMGETILDPIRKISDHQFFSDKQTLYEVLLEASVVSVTYDKFVLTDVIDSEYFDIDSVSNINPSIGDVELIEENGEKKVFWKIENLISGTKPSLTIDVNLKKVYQNQDGYYPTNKEENINYKIKDVEETFTSTETPILKSYYQVSYEGNVPSSCTVDNVPEATQRMVYETVEISDTELSCKGYQFLGWKIVTKDTYQMNDNSFQMPEHDVLLRAEWSKLTLAKSMNGEIYVRPLRLLQSVDSDYNKELWKYKDSITKIVFQDYMNEPLNTQESWDISDAQDGSVMGRLVLNDGSSDTYTAYIQGDGRIVANSNSRYLFQNFSKLETIEGLEYFDTSNVNNMRSMFDGCKSLISLDLSYFDTSKVRNMYAMFDHCTSLQNLNVSSFDTSNVEDMAFMFEECSSLTELDLSNFVTAKVTNMRNMFTSCSSFTNLDIKNFDTSNVTDMSYMFHHCSSLTSLDLSNFRTEKVLDMNQMFMECNSLSSLDISNFDTSVVTNMAGMFGFCSSLENLNVSHFDTSNVTTMRSMFDNCMNLNSLDLSNFSTGKVEDMRQMFMECTSLTSLIVNSFDMQNVTDMGYMFYNCNKLTSLDVSGFYTPKVTNLKSTFQGCSGISTLDVSHFDTSNVTDMFGLFNNCSKLASLDVSNFDTQNVTDMSNMFYGCSSLTVLNLSSFTTPKVTTMISMFYNCSGLTNLNVSNFDTKNVRDMSFMFCNCSSLTELDLSSFITSKAKTMRSMFQGCVAITNLNVSNFNTSNVTNMNQMFYHCDVLESVDLSSFSFVKVTNTSNMFYRNEKLVTTINMDASEITTYTQMFLRTATDASAKIIINYTAESSSLVDELIATKSSNSNVVKGELIVEL